MRKSPINENFDASYISSSVFRPLLSLIIRVISLGWLFALLGESGRLNITKARTSCCAL